MKDHIGTGWILATLLALPLSLLAATDANDPSNSKVDDRITVFGTRTSMEPIKLMLDFVTHLGAPVGMDFGYARLEGQVCFAVHEASPAVADYLVQRMAATAAELNLDAQKPKCKANVDVILSKDAGKLASDMVQKDSHFFRPFGNTPGTTQGLHALSEFQSTVAPVRWWQITVQVDRGGNPVVDPANPDDPPYVPAANSFLTRGLRDRLLGTLVIVDIDKLGDTSWDQLADYIAMVTLVQVDPHSKLAGYDTILNLFNGGTAAKLTAWDKAYLKAVYEMNLYMTPRSQKGDLAYKILSHLEQ